MKIPTSRQQLATENKALHARLAEAEETLLAIRNGEVDALVVADVGGERLLTLRGAEVYRTLVEEMSEGALTVAEGLVLYANRCFADMIRMPLEKVIGAPLLGWIAPESRPILQALLHQGEATSRRAELELLAGDRTRVPAYLSVNRLPSSEAPDVYCLVATDLTLVKKQHQLAGVRDSLDHTLRAIAGIVEMRDPFTAGHQARVADLAAAIARQMALSDDQVNAIHLAGTLHDLGKIQIPAEILSKPGKLNAAESNLIKNHAQASYDILKHIAFPWPIAQIVLQHHERLDGSGYPQGLRGDAILPEARILGVADVVEAMSSHRPYRPSLGIDFALAEITRLRGRKFDPQTVDACLAVFGERRAFWPPLTKHGARWCTAAAGPDNGPA
jgi:putative nucleotidyltransferase with HDIG domain